MSAPEETNPTTSEVQPDEIPASLGSQAVEGVIASHDKLAAALQLGPVRNILSPMVANPDLITM